MKKRIVKLCTAGIFAICLLSAGNMVFAVPICPIPYEVTQPDGTVLTVASYGDEFFSWTEDKYGNVIAYDVDTDSYRYVKIKDGELVPTSEMVRDAPQLRSSPQRLQREDILPLWENADRTDYSQTAVDDSIALMSASKEPAQEKPLTHQKLLTLLIEFNDVKLKYDGEFWQKRMFSTYPKDLSVVNYWKENANGLDVFEPADTSRVQDGNVGIVSFEEYADIGYTVTKCPEGVVKVSLDMPHPIKTWNNNYSEEYAVVALALRAVEPYLDITELSPRLVAIFAGYNMPLGDGQGQILGNVSGAFMHTSDDISLGKFVVQGELSYDDTPAGIGITCHELGHAIFNLPDLYFSFIPNGGWTSNGIMYCSLMSTGCWGKLYNYYGESPSYNIWNDPYAEYGEQVPSHLDPWCKIQCGFITPTIINEWDGDVNSISENGMDSQYNVLEIRSKTAAEQYFLVENRQLIGYDAGLTIWNEARGAIRSEDSFDGGIIIYHVDEGVITRNYNADSLYHHFIQVEQSVCPESEDDLRKFIWEYVNRDGRSQFNADTKTNSNLHELKTGENWSCDRWKDCHPQTLKSGISVEVLGENSPSMRVKVNVDDEYRVTMVEGAKYSDIFPDANFCRAVMDNMEKKDGMARESDDTLTIRDWATLSSITELQVGGYGIKDITGIEYFPNLEILDCPNNEMTDLSPITPAQIHQMSDLNCAGNKLTRLDMSKWVNLIYLYCNDNQLTEIDISNSEYLYDFICSNNLLTELDVSQNPELSMLECANNKLTSLDLTNNPELELLICYENFMNPDTPEGSIIGLEALRDTIGPPLSKDDVAENKWFVYYPQNAAKTEHNWSSAWQKDDTHHWHDCTDADCPITSNAEKDGYGEHTWDSGKVTTQPTCTTAGVKTYTCTVCQATKTEEIAAGHKYGTDWKSDQANHWHECACGDKADMASHVYDDTTDTTCNTCGYKRTVTPSTPTPPGSGGGSAVEVPTVQYTITATAGTGGQIDPSGKVSITKNKAQSFTITPDEGYTVADVLVDGKSVGAVEIYTFEKVTQDHTIEVRFSIADDRPGWNPFVDVKSKDWFHDSVKYIYEQGLMVGTDKTHFSPRLDTSRAMIATILWRLEGSPAPTQKCAYTDCRSDAYYAQAVAWGTEKGILNGYGGNLFGPDDPITREQLASMLYRYAGSPTTNGTLDGFSDSGKISKYALDALSWAVENGIMAGKGNGILNPKGNAIRAEAAAMLQRYLAMKE